MKPPTSRRFFLLACLFLATFLPLAGSWLRWHGLPPDYGAFPPQQGPTPPGFNAIYFAAGCAFVLGVSLFLLFPRLFGFKAPPPSPPITPGPRPGWLVPGFAVMLVSWALMWFGPGPLARFTFVPLWWGFICVLDGWVYVRTRGRSLLAARRHEMLVLALVSVVGWYLFEYWNYFVLEDWIYPFSGLLTPFGNLVWYTLSYTTVWPVCFETVMLLGTFPALRGRWMRGPAWRPSRALVVGVLLVGLALQGAMAYYPYPLFWGLWVGSPTILGAALALAGYWTPLEPAAHGDWSRFVLMALATFFDGFVWEFWNFGSEAFRHGVPTNPNYWVYHIPYLNVGHFFSEMPALGYFGYLFFGLLVWVYWLLVAHLLGLDPDFAHAEVAASTPGDLAEAC